jgi:hypothetical protein
MRHHGLPEIMRVDNGTPFASVALQGLSQLSVWWIEQGIEFNCTDPYRSSSLIVKLDQAPNASQPTKTKIK